MSVFVSFYKVFYKIYLLNQYFEKNRIHLNIKFLPKSLLKNDTFFYLILIYFNLSINHNLDYYPAVFGKISIIFWYLLIFYLYCWIFTFNSVILFYEFYIYFLTPLFLFAFDTILSWIVPSICYRCFFISYSYAFFIDIFIKMLLFVVFWFEI